MRCAVERKVAQRRTQNLVAENSIAGMLRWIVLLTDGFIVQTREHK